MRLAPIINLFSACRGRPASSLRDVGRQADEPTADCTAARPAVGTIDPTVNAIVADAAHRAIRAGELMRAGLEDSVLLGRRRLEAEARLERAMPGWGDTGGAA